MARGVSRVTGVYFCRFHVGVHDIVQPCMRSQVCDDDDEDDADDADDHDNDDDYNNHSSSSIDSASAGH